MSMPQQPQSSAPQDTSFMTAFTNAYQQQAAPPQQQPQPQPQPNYQPLPSPQPTGNEPRYTLPPMPSGEPPPPQHQPQPQQPQQPPQFYQQTPVPASPPPTAGPQQQYFAPNQPAPQQQPYLPASPAPQQLTPLMQQAAQMGIDLQGVTNDSQLLAQMAQALESERQRVNRASQMAWYQHPGQQPANVPVGQAPAPPPPDEPWDMARHLEKAWGAPARDPVWDLWIQQGVVHRTQDGGGYMPAPGMEMLLGHPSFQQLNAYETAQRRIEQTRQLWNVLDDPIKRAIDERFDQLWQDRYVEQQTQQYLEQFQRQHGAMLANPVTREVFFGHVGRLEAAGMRDERQLAETALQLMGYQQQQPQQPALPQPTQQYNPAVFGPPPVGLALQQPAPSPALSPMPIQQPPAFQPAMPQQPAYDPRQAFMQAAIASAGMNPQGAPYSAGQENPGEISQQQLENMFTDAFRRTNGQQFYNRAA